MRILLINHFPLEGSGSGTYTINIAKYLKQSKNEVSIIMPENSKNYSTLPGIDIHPVFFTHNTDIEGSLPFNFPCFTTHPRSNTSFGTINNTQLDMYLDAFDDKIKEVCASFKPHVIHAQHIWALSFLASSTGIPCVITSHGTDIMGYKKYPSYQQYADIAVQQCNKIIAISKNNYNEVFRIFPHSRKKLSLISNGFDSDIFYREAVSADILSDLGINYNGEKIVMFAGKLTHFKGVDVLLSAMSLCESISEHIITLIVGQGNEELKLKSLANKLNLKKMFFLGHRSQHTLRKLYNLADVSVIPSRHEPFGLVALEAMACGTPVIVTNEGGLTDFVTPDVGTLIPSNDAFALSTAIFNELSKTRNSESIAEYAQNNYSQSAIISQVEQIYKSLI